MRQRPCGRAPGTAQLVLRDGVGTKIWAGLDGAGLEQKIGSNGRKWRDGAVVESAPGGLASLEGKKPFAVGGREGLVVFWRGG